MSVTGVRNSNCMKKQCYAMVMRNTLLKQVINTTFIKYKDYLIATYLLVLLIAHYFCENSFKYTFITK
jgi:hypothetical protein